MKAVITNIRSMIPESTVSLYGSNDVVIAANFLKEHGELNIAEILNDTMRENNNTVSS
jgi:hypothetical protein